MGLSIVNIYFVLVLSVFAVFSSAATGQEIKAEASFERDSIDLGDQILLTLELESSDGLTIELPEVSDTIGLAIEVLRQEPVDTIVLKDRKRLIRQKFIVTCFDEGTHIIPPFVYRLKYDELEDSIETGELRLFVNTIDVDMERGPVDIKRPFSAHVTFKEIAPILFGVILALALIYLVIYMIRQRRKNAPLFQRAPKPREPAHVIALRALSELKNKKLWQSNRTKEYYSRVTCIVRSYIEERFHIKALEQTTAEIMRNIESKESEVGQQPIDMLRQILELADFVKFAKLSPTSDENQITIANAYFFVEQTKVDEKKDSSLKSSEGEVEETTYLINGEGVKKDG